MNKPKILTESDRIFSDLSDELSHLKDRMSQLEKEQESNKSLIDQISYQEQLASKLVHNQKQEISGQRENYQVIANVMHNLKTPVSRVMKNLASIIGEIDDLDTQDSLKDCMNTAANVLDDFNEVEEFCLFESQEFIPHQTTLDLQHFFTELVSQFQLHPKLGQKHSLKLLIDSTLKGQHLIQEDTLGFLMDSLLEEIARLAEPGILELNINIAPKDQEIGGPKLKVSLSMNHPTHVPVKEGWVDFVKANEARLKDAGFGLLKAKDRARQAGGTLEIYESEGKLQGFIFNLPLAD